MTKTAIMLTSVYNDSKSDSNLTVYLPVMESNFTSTAFPNTTTIDSKCDEIMQGLAPPPPTYGTSVRYVISGLLFMFPCVTMIGNLMVILAVLTHKRLQTVTNTFVVSLATADIFVAILVMPFGIYQQFNNKDWQLGREWCLITTSFDVMFTTTSIFNLSCLAIDRYLAICRPFVHERLTRPKVVMMLSFCWIVPIFISFVPILNKWNTIGIEEYVNCAFPPDDETSCAFVVNKVFAIVCSSIAFYIPTIFIVICNVHIYSAARKQAHQIRSLELSAHKHHRKGKLKHETKAAKTVGIIMGCFFVCWLPFFVLNIIDPFIGYRVPYTVWTTAVWLGYINSMMNPFLYYKFNRHYKMAFRRLLNCKVCRGISEFEDDMVPSMTYTDLSHSNSATSHSALHVHNNGSRYSMSNSAHVNNNVEC